MRISAGIGGIQKKTIHKFVPLLNSFLFVGFANFMEAKMATMGAVSLLLTAGIASVRGVFEENTGGSEDAISKEAWRAAKDWAAADVSSGGVSSLLNPKTAALVIPILTSLFAFWATFRSSGSSELAALKDRARAADDLIDQTVYTLGIRLNATDHNAVKQSISDLAGKHQKCLRDDSQVNEMFAHLKQEVEAGWFSASDHEKASMTRHVPDLKLDVFQPVASGMEIWGMVHNWETCHLGHSKAQGEITNKTMSQTELREQESVCQRELSDAKNLLSSVIDENTKQKSTCEQKYRAKADSLRNDIADLKKKDAVCSIELLDCRKKI